MINIGDARSLAPNKEPIVVVTGQVRGKGVATVQHDKCEADRIDTSDKFQGVRKAKLEEKGREVGDDEDTICL